MSGEPETTKPEPVTGKAICEEKPFFFKGKKVLGYFPVNDPESDPQFEACYTFLVTTQNGQKIPVNKSVILAAKTVEDAFAAFDAAVKEDQEKTEDEIRKQAFRQALGAPGSMQAGLGHRFGPNGFPGKR